MSPRWDTTIPLRALISIISSTWSDQTQGIKIKENRIRRNNKNQDRTKITLEEELNSGISKDQGMDTQREDSQFQVDSISLC